MMAPNTLQKRLVYFLLLPVAVLMTGMGVLTYLYARNLIKTQWQEATVLKLQRAAHYVDMRLSRPKDWIRMYHEAFEKQNSAVLDMITDHLRSLEGVSSVRVIRDAREVANSGDFHPLAGKSGDIFILVPPHQHYPNSPRTVSLISRLKDGTNNTLGWIHVDLRFDYLVEAVTASGWWHQYNAFIVDSSGIILTSTIPRQHHRQLGQNGNPLEMATLEAMKQSEYGTVTGEKSGNISGFYQLHEAPWTLIIFTPDKEILATVHRFTFYFTSVGSVFVLLILLLIKWVTHGTVDSIKAVSAAARQIAKGDFGTTLPRPSECEVGELIRSFNVMTQQLEERIRLKDAMFLAKELQQCLLPTGNHHFPFVDIAGQCLYGDEPGGDYFDYFNNESFGPGRLGVAVGDVSGHDISSSLMMTTMRALLHGKANAQEPISQIISHVNRLLCRDTETSGDFMTLFFMIIDSAADEIQWVRAGHDPAIIYNVCADTFETLDGKGIPLGINPDWQYQEYHRKGWFGDHVILIGTDGIWEATNPSGEPFGKERLYQIIRQNHHRPSMEILQAIIHALETFRKGQPQDDDVTLVVLKPSEHVKCG